eukprot:389767-Pyramimonas_sp.AAC.1
MELLPADHGARPACRSTRGRASAARGRKGASLCRRLLPSSGSRRTRVRRMAGPHLGLGANSRCENPTTAGP